MAKQYILSEDESENDQKTITISETKEVIEEIKVTPAQLKREYQDIKDQIKTLKSRADAIVDTFHEIERGLNITIENKPTKLK